MPLFHKHKFEIIAKTYAKPMTYKSNMGDVYMSEDMAFQLANFQYKICRGFTTVLLRCECGRTKIHEMIGEEIK